MTPRDGYLPVIAGVAVGAIVSFLVAMVILKADKTTDEDDFEGQVAATQALKAESKGQTIETVSDLVETDVSVGTIKRIIFACDLGMGSSAMGASILRNKVKKAGLDMSVTNSAINNLVDEEGVLIITQEELAERAKVKTPQAIHVSVENFLNSPRYDEIVDKLKK